LQGMSGNDRESSQQAQQDQNATMLSEKMVDDNAFAESLLSQKSKETKDSDRSGSDKFLWGFLSCCLAISCFFLI